MSAKTMTVCISHSPLLGQVDAGEGGKRFIEGIDRARSAVSEFAPDVVVFFGPDHERALPALVPAFTLVKAATGYGDWGTPTDRYDVELDLVEQLSTHLMDREFDVALADDLAIDHGFGQIFELLIGSLGSRPIVPVVINCVKPPLVKPGRAFDFGSATGEFLATLDRKILVVGSGGLSHTPPLTARMQDLEPDERKRVLEEKLKEAGELVNPEWDRDFLRKIEAEDWDSLASTTFENIMTAGTGAHEVRTWLAALGASKPQQHEAVYEPLKQWITGMGLVVGYSG